MVHLPNPAAAPCAYAEMQVLRLWKGYRSAQLGWLISSGAQTAAEAPAGTLLAVIYSPRRGTVDVFRARHGPHIASTKVGRHARLVYAPGGHMPPAGCGGCRGEAVSGGRGSWRPTCIVMRRAPASAGARTAVAEPSIDVRAENQTPIAIPFSGGSHANGARGDHRSKSDVAASELEAPAAVPDAAMECGGHQQRTPGRRGADDVLELFELVF